MQKSSKPFKYLPMDLARFSCLVLPLVVRIKKLYLKESDGKKIKGGALIVANHTGFLDPVLVGTAFWYRRMFFLAAKEVMKSKLREVLLKGAGCIKIDRDISDIAAVRRCVEVLKDGKCLCVFPQGSIKRDGEIEEIKSGAVLMAFKADVPIVPVYFSERKSLFSKSCVIIGESINCREFCSKKIPSVTEINEISKKIQNAMLECKEYYEKSK